MSVESVAISRIIDGRDLIPFIDAGVTDEWFHEAQSQQAYIWCLAFWMEHHEVPLDETFRRRFANFKYDSRVEEPTANVIVELRNSHIFRMYADTLPAIREQLQASREDFKPDETTAMLQELLGSVDLITSEATTKFVHEIVLEFVEDLIRGEGMPGIPLGFPLLDQATGGLLPEQFLVLIGAPKRGKSSLLLAMAMAAQKACYKAMFISTEMSYEEQMARYLSLGAHVPLTAILRRDITDIDQSRLEQFEYDTRIMARDGGLLIIVRDKVPTLGGLLAKIRQHKPDVVYVDGAYFMVDESVRTDSDEQRMRAVSRGLKRIAATERIPVAATTQALESKMSKSVGTTMYSAGYSSAWGQDADIFMGVDKPDLRLTKSVLKIIAARSMAGLDVNIDVNWRNGIIEEKGLADESVLAGLADDDDDPEEWG